MPETRSSPPEDALALAQRMARGELSAVAALEQALARVQRLNPRLNAVAALAAELGHERARQLDAERAQCKNESELASLHDRYPFFGVPLLLKDVGPATAHTRLPSRMGSRAFGEQGVSWPTDGTLTRRYLAAGFVPFGRSTSPEMGMSASTEAVAYGGPTRNPHDLSRSAGGSSGGAASALASGMVAIAHANDGAGSIRIPAAASGLVGLKPSRGLIPTGPLVGEAWGGLAIDHMLTRSVRDCAVALDISAGSDAGAPYAAPRWDGRAAELAIEVAPPPLRIGLCNHFFEGDAVDAEVAAAVEAFARWLEGQGHAVIPVRLPFTTREVVHPVMQVVATGSAMILEGHARARGRPLGDDELEPVTASACRTARALSAVDYLQAVSTFHTLARRMGEFHEHYDLLLTPTLAEPAARLGRFAMNNPDFIDYRLGPQGLWRYTPFTPLANATGAPSIALAVGKTASGLPLSAMLGAALGQDLLLLRVARQWELSGQMASAMALSASAQAALEGGA